MNTPEAPERDDEDDAPGTGRRMDEEIKALSQIVRILDTLSPIARDRAAAWLQSRYFMPPF